MINLAESWASNFTPPDNREIWEWAADFVRLPSILTRTGKFSIEGSNHFKAPLEALRHDSVRGVRILKPIRGGGSLIADLFASWAIANRNTGLLWVFQDEVIAEKYAEARFFPIIENCAPIARLMPSDANKKRKRDVLLSSGKQVTLQGPAWGGLQSFGFQTVINDEPWLYKPGVLAQAKGRMQDFVKQESNKYLAISQGGEEEGEWAAEYGLGEEYVFSVPCDGCGVFFAPEWTIRAADRSMAGIVYDEVKYPNGEYNRAATAASVRYRCHHCGHEHANTNSVRARWVQRGKHVCVRTGQAWDKASPPPEVSFRWSGLIDNPWAGLVGEWLAANEAKKTGNLAPLIAFLQKKMALMRSERSIHDSELAFTRVSVQLTSPTDSIYSGEIRILTADRQKDDLYWVMIRAWAPSGGRSRRLWFGKCFSENEIDAKREEFSIDPSCTIIDSGYHARGDRGVYAACIRFGWVAAKGDGNVDSFLHEIPQQYGSPSLRVQKLFSPTKYVDPGETAGSVRGRYAPLVRFASNPIADRVHALIQRGLWEEPEVQEDDPLEREYRIQMTDEYKKVVSERVGGVLTGRKKWVWVSRRDNNHAFDDAKMQVLAAIHMGILPDGLESAEDFKIQNDEPNES